MSPVVLMLLLLGVSAGAGGSSLGCSRGDEIPGWVDVACGAGGGGDPAATVFLRLDRNNYDLQLECQHGAYTCSMMSAARSHFESSVNLPVAIAINKLEVIGCTLGEPLACVLGAIHATHATKIILKKTRGDLLPVHVDGLSSVKELEIWEADDNFTSVPYEALSNLSALSTFIARKGRLRLREEPGQNLPQLTTLELSDGKLKMLPARSFSNTPHISILSLWGNEIYDIDEDAFEGLSNLEVLNLNFNAISSLPPRLLRPCRSLTSLHLAHNELKVLPAQLLHNLTRLEEVDISRSKNNSRTLSHCGLRTLPEKSFQGTPLHISYLKGNSLIEIPAIFSDVKLMTLHLSYNKIEQIRSGVFCDQTALETLDLSENLICCIRNGSFDGLNKLTELDLSRNKVQLLESSCFDRLPALRRLDLSHNQLSTLDPTTFYVLRSLRVLSVSHNELKISRPDDCLFSELLQLNILQLQHNLISVVCEEWRVLTNLDTLDLSYNAFTQLSRSDMKFTYLTRAATVDFSHNRITNVAPYVYSTTAVLPTFLLNDNPYSCDCALYPFIRAHKEKESIGIQKLDDLICASPPNLTTKRSLAYIQDDVLSCSTCVSNCSCGIRMSAHTAVYELNCSSFPPSFPATDLQIQMTLTNVTNSFPKLPPNVKHLILYNLSMTESPYINATLNVDLRHNLLTQAPLQLFEDDCHLKLAHNPFKCDCDNQQTFMSLKRFEKQIIDFPDVTCEQGLSIHSHRVEELCLTRYSLLRGITISAILVFSVVGVLVLYSNQTIIRIYLAKYGLWCNKRDRAQDKKYDAFVSFADEDEQYVYQQLIPNLESGKWPLKLCIPCRDWQVGGLIPEQISRSVQESRVTVVVLSRYYGKSALKQIEFRTAQALQPIVVILTDDVTNKCSELGLTAYTSTSTCIKASDRIIWDKLKYTVRAVA